MLVSLKMKCFRKHEDRTINFTEGLNAIRGANESGKSTMYIAMAYALWGSKTLPLPLEEMVTWGHSVKELKVEMVISVSGEMYCFTRSSSGAECNHSGGVVTGQVEVTKFATSILGVDADTAMKMMFAPQGKMRGALESGPTAISQYIEDMSGMDLFDILTSLMQEHLVTGPTALLDSAIAEAEEKVAAGEPTKPDVSVITTEIELLDKDQKSHKNQLVTLQQTAQDAADAFNQAKAVELMQGQRLTALERAKSKLTALVLKRGEIDIAAAVKVDTSGLESLRESLTSEAANQRRLDAYAAFSKIDKSSDSEWEGTMADMEAEQVKVRSAIAERDRRIVELNGLKRESAAKIVVASACGYCAKDFSQFPEVAKNNAALQATVDQCLVESHASEMMTKDARETESAIISLVRQNIPVESVANKYSEYLTVDTNFVPFRVTWNGDVPSASVDVAAIKESIRKIEVDAAKVQLALLALTQCSQDTAEAQSDWEALQLQATEEVPDVAKLQDARNLATSYVNAYVESIAAIEKKIMSLESKKTAMFYEYEVAKKQFVTLQSSLAEKRAQRDTLLFNNTLVKKVRAARPVVAAQLWSVVLASVSIMFTQMRGEQSIVTKGVKGFLVNGQPADAYSGSALDLLGLSIRVALLKTFIPDCSFMILDEATAACDDNRTDSLLGFIATCGFPQVLLVTHEETSSACAANLVLM